MKFFLAIAFLAFALATEPIEPQCSVGICCDATGKFKTAVNICRVSNNPCEHNTYCSGFSQDCPLAEKKLDGATCLGDGICTSGHCVRRQCVGECCHNGRLAEDGEKCALEKGTCHQGTCVVVVEPPPVELTDSEKKMKKLAEQNVRTKLAKELDDLLIKHEKVVIRRERRSLLENEKKESFLESLSDIPVISSLKTITTSTANNLTPNVVSETVEDLKASNDSDTPFYKTKPFLTLIGLCCVGVAVVILVTILKSGKKKETEEKPKRHRKAKDSEPETDSLYEPPEF